MEKKFVANKAVMVKDGKILLLRDAGVGDHANAKGMWDVPGGRMEAGETPRDALAREVREELGIEIEPSIARPFHVGLWGVGGDKVNNPIIGIFYLVPMGDATITLSGEHQEMAWIDPLQPHPDDFAPDIRDVIEAYRKTLN